MTKNSSQQRFLEDLKLLDLRFPVGEITKRTGANKGNVSRYIAGKLEPSSAFLEKFYESFRAELAEARKVPHETPQAKTIAPVADQSDIIKIIATSIEQQKNIDLQREQNRQDEIKVRSKEADNVTRLIYLLEQKANSATAAVEENELTQNAKLSALEGRVVALGVKLFGSSPEDESEALGTLEKAYYKAHENSGKHQLKSAGTPGKQKA